VTETPRRAGHLKRAFTAITGPWNGKNAVSWLLIVLAICIIRWGLFETYSIPSGSMEPTLHGDPRFFRGDRVCVDKLIYGPRIPFTTHRLFTLADPERWDIVVFRNLDENSPHKRLIKRIVGLPGERIHIQDGKFHVNGQPIEPPEDLRAILNYTTALDYTDRDVHTFSLEMAKRGLESTYLNPNNPGVKDLYAEMDALASTLADIDLAAISDEQAKDLFDHFAEPSRKTLAILFGKIHANQYPLQYGIRPEDQYAVVPDDCYLVCGDNSPQSVDGRHFGWLPNGNILGRAFCIWWPLDRMRDFTGFSKTWWGMLILYVLPVGLVAYELTNTFRRRRKGGSEF